MKKITVVGFKDEAKLVKDVARLVGGDVYLAETTRYRSGELKVTGLAKPTQHTVVAANIWEDPDVLFRTLLLSHELRSAGTSRLDLIAPWIAYGRQDHATQPGEEAAGIMVGRMLSAMFDRIVTLDAHSQKFIDGFKGKMRNVVPWAELKLAGKFDLVAAPDEGATSRASYAAESLGLPFIVIEKKRIHAGTKNGLPIQKIISILPAGVKVKGARILLVDDMADTGETLKAAAVELKKAGAKNVTASVSHAFDLGKLKKGLAPQIASVTAFFDHAGRKIDEKTLGALTDKVM
ncbi:ribose-phosphate pyrophosphokinase [Candidatus Uhrbacteria bacterium]|nr:ribose-phosphate pyrophosphokinase [Candidatus Uhrbacteria bacterium]